MSASFGYKTDQEIIPQSNTVGQMSCYTGKPVFRVSDEVQYKLASTVSEEGNRIEITDKAEDLLHSCSASLFTHMRKTSLLMMHSKLHDEIIPEI